MIINSTDATFATDKASGKPVLVDFWGEWCGPCKQLAPVLEDIATSHPEYTIIKVDVGANPATAKEFGVTGVPTIAILDPNGEVKVQGQGVRPKAALLAALEAVAATA